MSEYSVLRVERPPIETVRLALKTCMKIGGCDGCPYKDDKNCQQTLRKEMLKVIDWYEAKENRPDVVLCAKENNE